MSKHQEWFIVHQLNYAKEFNRFQQTILLCRLGHIKYLTVQI